MPSEEISYEEFGRRFFAVAVTKERVLAGFAGLTREPIAFGPIGAGPGRMAQVSARGTIGEPSLEDELTDEVAFRLMIPVELKLKIDLGVDVHRFDARLGVGLRIRARARDLLRVVVEVDPPEPPDIEVDLRSSAVRSEALRRVAGIDREIARFVARYIAREIDKPEVRAARDIDVAARIDSAWTS